MHNLLYGYLLVLIFKGLSVIKWNSSCSSFYCALRLPVLSFGGEMFCGRDLNIEVISSQEIKKLGIIIHDDNHPGIFLPPIFFNEVDAVELQ